MNNEQLYLIWSNEHTAWWKRNRYGYTNDRSEAGRFTLAEASEIVQKANCWTEDDLPPQEAMVPEDPYWDVLRARREAQQCAG